VSAGKLALWLKFVTSQPLPGNHQCSTPALAHIVRDWAGNKDRE